MSTGGWILLVVVIVVVAAAIVVAALDGRRRRRAKVQEMFGPEYERSLARTGDHKAAEQELLERAERRRQLDIRPLDPDSRRTYATQWHAIQSQFVDDPAGSITAADRLLDAVLRQRGYPVDDFDQKADLISVDHPELVQNYREARQVRTQHSQGQVLTTDRLRYTLLNYRALFEELLEDHSADR